jgi:predicted HTH domain antitoxin
MKTLEIQLPESIALSDEDILLTLSLVLYSKGQISVGHAASIAKISTYDFIQKMEQRKLNWGGISVNEIGDDVLNA